MPQIQGAGFSRALMKIVPRLKLTTRLQNADPVNSQTDRYPLKFSGKAERDASTCFHSLGRTMSNYAENDRIQNWLTAKRRSARQLNVRGFTLLELIVIVVIISILFAIMAPGWASFLTGQRLNNAQNLVLQAMREAQSRAKQNRIVWQASFQTTNDVVQWAVHPIGVTPAPSFWSNLDSAIQMDAETTLQQAGGVRRVQFDHEGNVNGQLGRLTLSSKSGGKAKRCVIASTLLGAMRTGSDRPTMQDGKYCY